MVLGEFSKQLIHAEATDEKLNSPAHVTAKK